MIIALAINGEPGSRIPPSQESCFQGKWNRKSMAIARRRSPEDEKGSKINGINVFRARSRFRRKSRPPRVDLRARRKILAARSRATSPWSRGLYAPIRSGSFLASKEQALSTCCKAKRKGWVHLSGSIRRKKIATWSKPFFFLLPLSPSRPDRRVSRQSTIKSRAKYSRSLLLLFSTRQKERISLKSRSFRTENIDDEFFPDYRFFTLPSFLPIRTDPRV